MVPVPQHFDEDYDVVIENATLSWRPDPSSFKLTNIDLKVPKKSLTVVIGSTGSGKSSVLASILGEVPKLSGKIYTSTDVKAYVPQEVLSFTL